MQEALLAAAIQWPAEGLPDNPRGWLIQVGVAPADRRWSAASRPGAAARSWSPAGSGDQRYAPPRTTMTAERDDTLVLLFLCCHPALAPASAIALTLRAVGGLTTAEIARAFLVPEATMAQRISRAKQRIQAAGRAVPACPTPAERAARLRAVLHVLYLIFNEGYTSSTGPGLHRVDLTRRGDPADPRAARAAARRRRGRPGCWR